MNSPRSNDLVNVKLFIVIILLKTNQQSAKILDRVCFVEQCDGYDDGIVDFTLSLTEELLPWIVKIVLVFCASDNNFFQQLTSTLTMENIVS